MSGLPFELLLALRYLRPKRTFVSIITLISIVGVALGVAVLIIVISVMSGFDRQLRDKVFGFSAHLSVFQMNPRTGGQVNITNYESVIKTISANPSVTAVTPFIVGPVLVQTEPEYGPTNFSAPFMRGIDPSSDFSLSLLTSNNFQGSADLSDYGLLVGIQFAEDNNLRVGDRVAISSPDDIRDMIASRKEGQDEAILPRDYEIRGIFDAGYWDYNKSFVITSLENSQNLYRMDHTAQGLFVMLKDPYQVKAVQKELLQSLGPEFAITTWMEQNSFMMAVLVEKNVMFFIMFFIVLVAAFGITCTLITFVVQKTREIGVMKALGATNRQIRWIFLSQSLAVSLSGVIVGTGAGLLMIAIRNDFLTLMRKLTGIQLFPQSIYSFSALPAEVRVTDIALICGCSLLICLLASALPAWVASRFKPVEALRHE